MGIPVNHCYENEGPINPGETKTWVESHKFIGSGNVGIWQVDASYWEDDQMVVYSRKMTAIALLSNGKNLYDEQDSDYTSFIGCVYDIIAIKYMTVLYVLKEISCGSVNTHGFVPREFGEVTGHSDIADTKCYIMNEPEFAHNRTCVLQPFRRCLNAWRGDAATKERLEQIYNAVYSVEIEETDSECDLPKIIEHPKFRYDENYWCSDTEGIQIGVRSLKKCYDHVGTGHEWHKHYKGLYDPVVVTRGIVRV